VGVAPRFAVLVSLIVIVLISACASSTSSTPSDTSFNKARVDEIIVRYQPGAPMTAKSGGPWGTQCVSRTHRDNLTLGRGLGARMRVLRLQPPVSPPVAAAIAEQIARCRLVEWAEADAVQFTIP
jgi:hypothetical protein